jgi:hypothetical protein
MAGLWGWKTETQSRDSQLETRITTAICGNYRGWVGGVFVAFFGGLLFGCKGKTCGRLLRGRTLGWWSGRWVRQNRQASVTIVDISDLEQENESRERLNEMFAMLDEACAKADKLSVKLFESISDAEKRKFLKQYEECRDAHVDVAVIIHGIKQAVRLQMLLRHQLIQMDMKAERQEFSNWKNNEVRRTYEIHGEAMVWTIAIMFAVITAVLWGMGKL